MEFVRRRGLGSLTELSFSVSVLGRHCHLQASDPSAARRL